MSQRKKKREPTPTRVALVCLKTTQNNIQINNQSLLKVFSKHGSISKFMHKRILFRKIKLLQVECFKILYSKFLQQKAMTFLLFRNVSFFKIKKIQKYNQFLKINFLLIRKTYTYKKIFVQQFIYFIHPFLQKFLSKCYIIYSILQNFDFHSLGQLQTKVFIEYDEVDSAIDAIKSLNNTKILNQISCNVYHSRLKQLKLDTVPYTKGLDFTNPPSNTTDQIEPNEEQQEIARINEWEDFQFGSNSTDEVSDEEEPQFSEEKMVDILTRLNQIDDEINKTIETKIVTALDKLQQNTMCIQVLITYDILNDLNFVIKIFCLFGEIKYLKQSQIYIYIKYGSNMECEKAYQLLKDYLEIKIQYNFENVNGKLIQPNYINYSKSQEAINDQVAIQELFQSYKIIKQQNNSLIKINQ